MTGVEQELVNAEAVVIGLLGTVVGETNVGVKLPNPRPPFFVRVQRVGGAERNLVQEQPYLLIECWGNTQQQAWDTAKDCWSLLHGRNELSFNGVDLTERSVSSPVNYPDPSTTSPRYQFQLQTTINLKGLT